MAKPVTDEVLLASLKRVERFAVLMDSCFRIPFTRVRFGLDSIIGVVPILGETVGFIMAMYLIFESYKLGLPTPLKIKMLGNAVLDWFVGLVPFLGDVGDVAFKANTRNMNIILRYVNDEYERRHAPDLDKPKGASRFLRLLILILLLFILGFVLVLQFYVDA